MDWAKIIDIVTVVSYAITALVLFATAAVKITGKRSAEDTVSTAGHYWLRLLRYLPTFGVNPQTKLLEDELEKLWAQEEDKKPATDPGTPPAPPS